MPAKPVGIYLRVLIMYIRKSQEKQKNTLTMNTSEEPEKGLTYLIESKMSSIVRHTIILWATKEEKAKHWQLNNDKLLIERLITLSEILVCAKKCVLRLMSKRKHT